MSNDPIVIVSAKRTAIGNLSGGLSSLPASHLGKLAIEAVLADAGLAGADDQGVVAGVRDEAPAAVVPCADQAPPPPPGDRPPAEAGPGEAWCRVWIPPVNEMQTERVLVQPARKVKRWIAPVYGKRMKVVCGRPAEISEQVVPGQYGTRRRTIVTDPGHDVWSRVKCGNDPCGCQECWKKDTCPPKTEDVCERVCIEPSRTVVKFRPAEWKVVEEEYMVEPGRCEEICVPARYETRARSVCKQPGRWEWRRNPNCDVPVAVSLPALEVELIDQRPDGSNEGIFARGELVRYELRVKHDEGSEAMADLGVHFKLPPELEFVSGRGVGTPIAITGSGQEASSSVFTLHIGDVRVIELMAKVVGVPSSNLVKLEASVQTHDGHQLATETESTTLKEGALTPTSLPLTR